MRPRNIDLYNLDIQVIHRGRVRLDASWRSSNAKDYFTRLYFVKSGSGYLRSREGTVKLEGGSIYLAPSEYDFGFGCEKLEKVFFHVLLPAGEKPDILSEIGRILVLPNCRDIIETVYQLYDNADIASLLRTKLLIFTVLDRFISQYNLHFSGKAAFSPLVTDALDYIWHHVSPKLSVSEISQRLYVSDSKLRNAFKAETGTAIGKYIDDAVFFTVRKMLTAGFSIEQISGKLRFCDRNYLSRRFKEKYGKTVSQYKRDLML